MSSSARVASRMFVSHRIPTRRTVSSLSTRLDIFQTSSSSSPRRMMPLSMSRNSWCQQRTMVVVTKTSSAELAADEKILKESSGDLLNNSNNHNNYTVLSEDLIITPSCLARVEKLIQLRKSKGGEEEPFLRVFVDAGGCSGFQYQFEMDDQYDPDEDITLVATTTTTDAAKPRIVIDETSLGFLKGSTLDYIQELAKSAFVVSDNPQSESACGCGSSFAVKNFSANPALD